MCTQIATVTPIPLPTNPAQLPSLPAWLQQRSDALVAADKDQYQHRQVLPERMILTSAEAAEVQQHIAELGEFLRLDRSVAFRGEIMGQEAALGAMIASLLLKSGQKLEKAMADCLTEDYFDALEDMPAWTVREALRKWNRGESVQLDPKGAHDFRWAPKPPILRRLADYELARVKSRIIHLQRLCDASPIIEYSDEHRKGMLTRLSALFHDCLNPLKVEAAE